MTEDERQAAVTPFTSGGRKWTVKRYWDGETPLVNLKIEYVNFFPPTIEEQREMLDAALVRWAEPTRGSVYDYFRKMWSGRFQQHKPLLRVGSLREEMLDWWIDYWHEHEERIIPMGDVNRPQQDPKPGKTSVTDLVMKDLQVRRDAGIVKYKTELKTENGRDALVDLYQELMDAVMYIRQAIEERDAKAVRVPLKTLEQLDLFEGTIDPIYDGVKLEKPLDMENLYLMPGRFIPINGFTPTPDPKPETILEEAQRLVHGDRGDAYGHPIIDMTRSADMVTALIRTKLRVGMRLEAEDIGQIMVAVKMSRHRNSPKRDNLTDTAGYAETLSMIKTWREEHPGVDPRDCF